MVFALLRVRCYLFLCVPFITDPSLLVHKVQEVAIANFIAHPIMAVAITLTTITTDTSMYQCHKSSRHLEQLFFLVTFGENPSNISCVLV